MAEIFSGLVGLINSLTTTPPNRPVAPVISILLIKPLFKVENKLKW
jgi:hypothetical protein